jgi:hypothetical protein
VQEYQPQAKPDAVGRIISSIQHFCEASLVLVVAGLGLHQEDQPQHADQGQGGLLLGHCLALGYLICYGCHILHYNTFEARHVKHEEDSLAEDD